jgi:predicted enzyme related to lactoylglutathione lyase
MVPCEPARYLVANRPGRTPNRLRAFPVTITITMSATSLHRLAITLAAVFTLGAGLPASGSTGTFQPLNNPATHEQHPGKFVWADLFTTDPVAATKFYTGLFGWTASTIDQKGRAYTVFSSGGHPVAGLAPRHTANLNRPSRWIGYIAVADINSTLARVAPAGGQVRGPARDFPDRGQQAIITDSEGSPVGLIQSSSGDGIDDEPDRGEWNWFELYGRDPKAATGFYATVFNYTVKPDDRTERKNDYLLISGKVSRAGVAPLPKRDDAASGWLGVVRVANMDEAVTRVKALGGEVLVAPRSIAYESRFAIIADPTGGTLGLVEYVDNANPATRP